ncbi:MAG: hypothetical protein ACI83O_000930 [Patescibacteria group bacterium]|jgi:hypothetical protein
MANIQLPEINDNTIKSLTIICQEHHTDAGTLLNLSMSEEDIALYSVIDHYSQFINPEEPRVITFTSSFLYNALLNQAESEKTSLPILNRARAPNTLYQTAINAYDSGDLQKIFTEEQPSYMKHIEERAKHEPHGIRIAGIADALVYITLRDEL